MPARPPSMGSRGKPNRASVAWASTSTSAYVHSSLGKTLYVNPNLLPGQGNIPLGPQCPAGGASSAACFDYGPATSNLSGRETPISPQLTISGGIEYGIALPGGALTPRLDYSFTSHQWQSVRRLPASI